MSEGTTTPKKKRLILVKSIDVPKVELVEVVEQPKVLNKGTGAGGANTNLYGKKFEDKTNNELRLLEQGYTKQYYTDKKFKKTPAPSEYYLSKTFEDKTVVFVLQGGLKRYMKQQYNIEIGRYPDEAYIIEYNAGRKVLKILEKKEQHVNGSVDTKLLAGPGMKQTYELAVRRSIYNFEVYYGFCVNTFLKNKLQLNNINYKDMKECLKINNIPVLFGDDEDYFETLDKWLAI
jgi:hypothetical protein